MNCTCNCIAFIQIITYNLSNIRPSFFRSLSTDNTFFHLLYLSCRSARCFANGMTTQCCQPWQSRVCLCRKPLCLYTFFDLLALFHPLWERFCERQNNTDPCFSHGQLYVACSTVGNPTNIYIPAPEGKTKNFSDIPISLHVFAFLLIVGEDTVFIHDAAFFFLHVCAFA